MIPWFAPQKAQSFPHQGLSCRLSEEKNSQLLNKKTLNYFQIFLFNDLAIHAPAIAFNVFYSFRDILHLKIQQGTIPFVCECLSFFYKIIKIDKTGFLSKKKKKKTRQLF